MKQIYFLATLLIFNFINLNAQTVTLANACSGVNGDYVISEEVNGKPSYIWGDYIIQWKGTRWEHNRISRPEKVGMYNESDTENPPASSFSTWTAVLCDPAGDISGDGTSTTLSASDVQLSNIAIKLSPNPSSNFIKLSGLTKEENYSIYNIHGTRIMNGKISDNQKMDIQQLSIGLYLLKLERGKTIKLVKK